MAALVELHVHLEGTMPPRVIRELAKRNRVDVPAHLFIDDKRYRWRDFMDFIKAYDVASEFIQNASDLEFITYDYLKSVAEDGGIYVELTISPDHAQKVNINYPAQLAAITQACERAKEDFDIEARLIVVLVRHEGLAQCEAVLKNVIRNPHPFVVGIGLAGDEQGFPPAQFSDLYKRAKDAGLGLSAHAGEWCGPKLIEEAVTSLGISRLGHGVRAVEDKGLLRELIEQGIHFELCPGSNVALKVYPSISQHPLLEFQAMGASFSLNSDDPPFFATSVAQEYQTAREQFGFTEQMLLAVSRNAIDASFADFELKKVLKNKLT